MNITDIISQLPVLETQRLLPALAAAKYREEGLFPLLTIRYKSGEAHHGRLMAYMDDKLPARITLRLVEGLRETQELVYAHLNNIESVQVHYPEDLLPELSEGKFGAFDGRELSQLDVPRTLARYAADLSKTLGVPIIWTIEQTPHWRQTLRPAQILNQAANLNWGLRHLAQDQAFYRDEIGRSLDHIELCYGSNKLEKAGNKLMLFLDERTQPVVIYREALLQVL